MQIESLVGAVLPNGEQVCEAHFLSFNSEQEANEAYSIIENYELSGSTGPIQLPGGEQLRPLTNGERWLLQKLLGVNLFLLIFSVIR